MVGLRTLRPAAFAAVGALIASSCAFAQEVRISCGGHGGIDDGTVLLLGSNS